MKLKAGTDFTYQVMEPTPVITMLRPHSRFGQFIQEDRLHISPTTQVTDYMDAFGNLCQRMLLQPGEVLIQTEVIAEVEAQVAEDWEAHYILVEDLPYELIPYLLPSRYCLSDTPEIGKLALEILGDTWIGYQQVAAFRQWIHQYIQYQYGVTYASTTSLDIFHNRAGVCRDFAHLGISLCRSINIPARMVVGYLKDLKIMDLHAWFEAYIGNKWYTFDAVQEKTTGGRIVLGYGRDAIDVASIMQFGNAHLEMMHVWVEEV
ncbi:MAG: transglutaminase family protein [Saprospiraceae bacterium]|nr:transglutaminase family protein [Saprospiraceae bacterium]